MCCAAVPPALSKVSGLKATLELVGIASTSWTQAQSDALITALADQMGDPDILPQAISISQVPVPIPLPSCCSVSLEAQLPPEPCSTVAGGCSCCRRRPEKVLTCLQYQSVAACAEALVQCRLVTGGCYPSNAAQAAAISTGAGGKCRC